MSEQALRQLLLSDPTVSGLIGTRIYPLVIPQDAQLPAIAYQKISGVQVHTHTGAHKPERMLVQLTCAAKTYSDIKTLQDALRNALDGKVVNGMAILVENVLDDYAQSGENFVLRLDVRIYS